MTRPGEPRPDPASMLRVNQAGEYGATRIYAGQLAVLRKDSPAAHQISRMAAQEQLHLDRFNALMTLAKKVELSPADVTKIAEAAPVVVEKAWIRALLKELLPATQDVDQALDLIRRIPVESGNSSGE